MYAHVGNCRVSQGSVLALMAVELVRQSVEQTVAWGLVSWGERQKKGHNNSPSPRISLGYSL
jgi:hypothetical protein